MFPERLETERLELERLHRETVPVLDLYEVCSAPEMDEVTRYVPWDRYETPADAKEFLDLVEQQWEAGETATYAVSPKESEAGGGELAGLASLGCDWDRRLGSLGTWFRKRYWGRGYSGERAAALLELAFDTLDLECVQVTHEVGNEQSERAIEKYVERFGGRREGVLRNYAAYQDGTVHDEVRYTVAREEYEASAGD
jgi:RimJ/RimL family protein N-acetyltransferase